MISLEPVPQEHLRYALPLAWRHLRGAIERSKGWTADMLTETMDAGDALLWVAIDNHRVVGAVVTEIIDREAWVALLGGERFAEWRGQITKVEAWARAAGCTSLHFDGRRGWVRRMAPDGFEFDGTRATKVIHG
jgi:hypothetical protein